MSIWRILLIPFACIYGLVIRVRHSLFDRGILPSESFAVPVIGVGNLCLGGTGKTPFVEYLVRLLSEEKKIAILSRGYGRKTKGFLLAGPDSSFEDIGDEPMQFFHKFGNELTIAVDKNRRNGIRQLMKLNDQLDVIILDDSFQHRYVKPGISILLTDSHKLYVDDYLLPAGRLRDTVVATRYADFIIVTKTNRVLSPIVRKTITAKLKPGLHQKLLFSYITYGKFVPFPGMSEYNEKKKPGIVILFTGIVNPAPLAEHIRLMCSELKTIRFPDHHVYSKKDLLRIKKMYDDVFGRRKIIITTEKDAMRLINSPYFRVLEDLPLFYIPIRVKIHEKDRQTFRKQILAYVEKNR